MPRQIPLEVTQGLPDPSQEMGGPPGYAPNDVPVEERGGVPYSVWEENQGDTPPPAKTKSVTADPASQPYVPDPEQFLADEKARANALGQQRLAADRAAGITVDQQLLREQEMLEEASNATSASRPAGGHRQHG